MKKRKVELDLDTVLTALVQWFIIIVLIGIGESLVLGHVAHTSQVIGGSFLVLAIYLLMPTIEREQ